jgi:hypothetical protein
MWHGWERREIQIGVLEKKIKETGLLEDLSLRRRALLKWT